MQESNLYRLVVQTECRNTHHKLVMNSLKRLSCPNAEAWANLFTRYFDLFLQGSKDPDTKFKDFRNHVIHVSENHWGGAGKKTRQWYERTVEELRNKDWKAAVYSAGVMSHYYMDPIMPLHTGQTEEEGVIHRAAEWSVNKSFDTIIDLLESGDGYPDVILPQGDKKIVEAVYQGAEFGHQFYDDFIDHYNLKAGSRNPPEGLDDHLRNVTAKCLGFASVGFARLLEAAIEEAAANPPAKSGGFMWGLYKVTSPISWLTNFLLGRQRRGQVNKIRAEFEATGKVIQSLPKDEKQVRHLHAKEILKVSIDELDEKPIRDVGQKHVATQREASRPARPTTSQRSKRSVFRLELSSELEAAPSIGKKTADRFAEVGIETVSQFLLADPDVTATLLGARHIDADSIRLWQTQTRLACEIPNIYGHDAQILAGCGFETPSEVAASDVESLLQLVDEYGKTKESEYVMRGKVPDEEEVTNWINWSQSARKVA